MSLNNFSLSNTVTQASSLNGTSLSTSLNPMGLKVLKGTVNPSAIGNYAVVDPAGSVLCLSPGDFVQNVALYGPTVTSAGAPTYNLGLATSNGGAVSSALITAPILKASVVAGYQQAGNLATSVTSATPYVSLTTATASSGGSIGVSLLVVNANNNNA
jgi:hypothetical protein